MRRLFVLLIPSLSIGLVGCGGTPPSAPTPFGAGLTVAAIVPASGPASGGTLVRIRGTGFAIGTQVTVNGARITSTTLTTTEISATMPANPAGAVDIGVTNPPVFSATVPGGYTYIDIPPPSITEVSPGVGSTGGGTRVTVTGSGFQEGAKVNVGGIETPVYVADIRTLIFTAPARPASKVAILVTNADGQLTSAPYEYAPPETFDFNGEWDGFAGPEFDYLMSFAIKDNLLVRASCGTPDSHTFSPQPAVIKGEFSTAQDGNSRMAGRIVAASQAVGTIAVGPCNSLRWQARKK